MRDRFGLIFVQNVTTDMQNYSKDAMFEFLTSTLNQVTICSSKEILISIANDIYFVFQWTNKFGKFRLRLYEAYCVKDLLRVKSLHMESLAFDTILEATNYMIEFYYGNLTAKSERRFDFGNVLLNVVLVGFLKFENIGNRF